MPKHEAGAGVTRRRFRRPAPAAGRALGAKATSELVDADDPQWAAGERQKIHG